AHVADLFFRALAKDADRPRRGGDGPGLAAVADPAVEKLDRPRGPARDPPAPPAHRAALRALHPEGPHPPRLRGVGDEAVLAGPRVRLQRTDRLPGGAGI